MQFPKFPRRQETKKANCRCALLIAAALLLISGCAAQGAKRVPRDRFLFECIQVKTVREMCLPPYVSGTTGTILITPILPASGL